MKSPHSSYSTQKTLEVAIDDLIIARFPTPSALRDNAEIVVDLLRDSIETFAIRTCLRTTRFEEAYSSAVRITLKTLDKPSLRGVCRFHAMPVQTALRWIKSRLLNNVKNVLTNSRYAEYIGHIDCKDFENVTFGNAEIEAELNFLSHEQVVKGIQTLFLEGADVGELEYIADRFNIDLNSVIGSYPVPVICEKNDSGNSQLSFDF